jgi:hypothetical protein
MKKNLLISLFLILIIVISASYILSSQNSNKELIEVNIAITENFGRELVQEDTIRVSSGSSVLDALKSVSQIETKYRGSFVTSINGIESNFPEDHYDWFFYVNGFLAKEGASSYIIRSGDSIQWDYHNWESEYHQSAIIGNYPKYFTNGYAGDKSPTIIVFENEFQDEASKIRERFLDEYKINVMMKTIETISVDEKSKSNVIILAKPSNAIVKELNDIQSKIGFNAYFENNSLIEMDCRGITYNKYNKAGVIQITQNVWNPEGNRACKNVILLISGTDTESVNKSANVLIEDFSEYRYSFGLIMTEDKSVKIPYCYEE